MAQGTFTALYQEVEMQLISRHQRVLLDILRGIAWHADALGMCWPGVDRLEYVTRRSKDTIPGYIEQLLDADLIRVHESVDPIRRQLLRTYQVSPYVLYIREELETEALALWVTGKNVMSSKDFVTKPRQPETEPDKEPENNQKQGTKNKTTTTTRNRITDASNEAGGNDATRKDAPAEANGKSKKHPQAASQPQSGAQTQQPQGDDQKTQPQRGGESASNGRGQATDMTPFRVPLADVPAELLALRLARNLGTREPQARQLVAEYGRDVVEAAERWLHEESAKGRPVDKPFGLLKWWLKQNCISPDDTPTDSPDQAAAGVTGKYADFFKR